MADDKKKPKDPPIIFTRKDGTTAFSWGGARGYSWSPFEAGNEAAVVHGLYSPRHQAAMEAEIAEGAIEVARELLETIAKSR